MKLKKDVSLIESIEEHDLNYQEFKFDSGTEKREDSQKNGKFIVTQKREIDLNKPQIKVTFSDLITL